MFSDFNYFRYIDNILLIYLQELNSKLIPERLNSREPSIKFTHELE